MDVVLDASSAAPWFLPDEFDSKSEELLNFVVRNGAIVPTLWAIEMQNILRNAHRRGRITESEAYDTLTRISRLPIRVVDVDERPVFRGALSLAIKHDLSVYDATYLDVAQRWRAAIATRDRRLIAVAQTLGITLVDA